jgi:hypothetical protein
MFTDLHGNALVGLPVSIVMLNSTTDNTNWLLTMFGLSGSATAVENTTISGITDSSGSFDAPVVASGYYQVTANEPSIGIVNWQKNVHPDQTVYVWQIATTASSPVQNEANYISSNLSAASVTNGNVTLNATYQDLSNTTSIYNFNVWNATQNLIYTSTLYNVTNVSSADQVNNVAGVGYVWGINAYTTTWGWYNISQGITMRGTNGMLVPDPFKYCGGWTSC